MKIYIKSIRIFFFVTVIFIVTSYLKCNFEHKETRPIKLTVIDSESGIPLEGISVYYELIEKKLKNISENFIPLGGPIHDFYHSSSLKYTDKQGNVDFTRMNKLGKKSEEKEYIFINIKPFNDQYEPVLLGGLSNLNKKYFGYYIENYDHCIDEPKNWGADPINGIV